MKKRGESERVKKREGGENKGQRDREDKVYLILVLTFYYIYNRERDDNKETNKARHR